MSFRRGQRVWCRTAFDTLISKVVIREQESEGPGARWPAVRVRDIRQGEHEGFNWPMEDVFAEGDEPNLPKARPCSTHRSDWPGG